MSYDEVLHQICKGIISNVKGEKVRLIENHDEFEDRRMGGAVTVTRHLITAVARCI